MNHTISNSSADDRTHKSCLLECCVDSVESAIAAKEGGADRLELCGNLMIGGTTPSPALFHAVRSLVSLPIHVLLRPRFGDFLYSDSELAILQEEAAWFASEGADGIVIGCLNADGTLNLPAMKALIACAPGKHITLHRAFDMCADPFRTLREAKDLGVHTILTSGCEDSCRNGMTLINEFIKAAGPDLNILVGGGVTYSVVKEFLARTDAVQFHMSGKVVQTSAMEYRNPRVHMGLEGFCEYEYFQTSKEKVAEVKALLR